jgi:RHS repeat-associated protein
MGQRHEATLGLIDYQARYYSPTLGRFISPDTIVPEPGSSQGWNRYAYANNNPLRYMDPSGHCVPGLCPGQNADYYNNIMSSSSGMIRYKAAIALNAALHNAPDAESWNTDSLRAGIANDAHLVATREGIYADQNSFWNDILEDGATAGMSAAAVFGGSGDNNVPASIFSENQRSDIFSEGGWVSPGIHGNSKLSTKPQHGYEIYEIESGDVVKTGISGQSLNKNGTSPRATGQVNALNRRDGPGTYDARIVAPGIPGRAAALDWERNNARRLFDEGNSMREHRRPNY